MLKWIIRLRSFEIRRTNYIMRIHKYIHIYVSRKLSTTMQVRDFVKTLTGKMWDFFTNLSRNWACFYHAK